MPRAADLYLKQNKSPGGSRRRGFLLKG